MHGVTFYRQARVYPTPLPEGDLPITPPPTLQSSQNNNMLWLQILLPLGSVAASGVMVLIYRNIVVIIAMGGVALLSVVASAASAIYQRRSQKAQTAAARDAYLNKYLKSRFTLLQSLTDQQNAMSARMYPTVAALAALAPANALPSSAVIERIWERRFTDRDFLRVRIGSGPAPLSLHPFVDTGSNPLANYDEELLARARALVTRFEYVEDSPIVVPLQPIGVLSLRGPLPAMRTLARSLVTQIAFNQAPEDVRICAYFPEEAQGEWSWLRWLPQTRRLRQTRVERGKPEQLSLLATSLEDFRALLATQLVPELERRRKLVTEKADFNGASQPTPMKPHLFVLIDGFSLSSSLGQTPIIQELLQDGPALGVTMICLTPDGSEEPATTQARISQPRKGLLVYEETAQGGLRYEAMTPDEADVADCERIARMLSPLIVAEKGAQQDLSQDVRLLDLLHIRSVDDIQIAQTWRPRAKVDLLRVPIGMQDDGEPLYVDIKEAAEGGMGPHGMVIGATGSGKSELLRTLVTSLAITHDPETLNFVLADFKGGASFADLAGLPHVSGMITNLEDDLSLVDRMRASLDGEMARRQRMLREAGNLDNIRQYQAKWRMTPTIEPMPYLLIIVDEFAELLTQRPDFIETFTAIGRVGRSLGVCMLLATQRLGEGRIQGLESYLRYRICLRTLTAAESMAVIGKNDAYFLSSFPGVGYFKVDAIYQRFKSAIVSVPYVAPGQEQVAETLVRTFSPVGALTGWEPAATRSDIQDTEEAAPTGVEDTEMDIIIDRLVEQCAQGRAIPLGANVERVTAPMQALGAASDSDSTLPKIVLSANGATSGGLTVTTSGVSEGYAPPHQVWLPPLRKAFPLGEVIATAQAALSPEPTLFDGARWPKQPTFGTLRIPIGQVDKPAEQAQDPLFLDFSGSEGHLVIVGAPQSGKSTLLRTMLTSFLMTHSPRDVQIYGIDLGGGLLRVFEGAPQVGAICGRGDSEKMRRMIRQMRSIIQERELLFREQSIDTMVAYRARRQRGELNDAPFGDVFLVVDDLAQLLAESDQFEPELIELAATGLTYGVHLILATNRWPDVRPRVRDNIGGRIELRLNDALESEIGKQLAKAIAKAPPGRGLTKSGLQFHTALPLLAPLAEEHEEAGQAQEAIKRDLDTMTREMSLAWHGPVAPPIRLLPNVIHLRDLWAQADAEEAAASYGGNGMGKATPRRGAPIGVDEFQLAPLYLDLLAAEPHFMILGDSECGKTNLLRVIMRGLQRRFTPEQAQFVVLDYRRQLLNESRGPHTFAYAVTAQMANTAMSKLRMEVEKRQLTGDNLTPEQLAAPRKWEGAHYFVLADDYDHIVTPMGNPLSAITELLLDGRDIGLHVILARRVGGVSRSVYEPVMQRLSEMGTPGLIMSGDPQEGILLGAMRAMALPPGRGYLARPKQRVILTQTALAD